MIAPLRAGNSDFIRVEPASEFPTDDMAKHNQALCVPLLFTYLFHREAQDFWDCLEGPNDAIVRSRFCDCFLRVNE